MAGAFFVIHAISLYIACLNVVYKVIICPQQKRPYNQGRFSILSTPKIYINDTDFLYYANLSFSHLRCFTRHTLGVRGGYTLGVTTATP